MIPPQFPLYIPSKGRSQYMVTSRVLTELQVPHFIVVEPDQIPDYEAAVQSMGLLATILELDLSYKARYELCDDLGLTKSTGPGPARNFAWDHSIAQGHSWHWVMDDNITDFYRTHQNTKIRLGDGTGFRCMEDFTLRYANVGMSGPNYEMFVPRRNKVPPFITNTRIYSCNLIRNDLPFRWRGRYNEDTILSLDMLKAGWCTIQFNAFLQRKLRTQKLGGGNTAEFYAKEGTLAKSKMQVAVHPDCSELVWKFNRWHHHVDYKRFQRLKLIRKPDLDIKPNDYGMTLMKVASS